MKPTNGIELTAKQLLKELKLRGSITTRAKQLARNAVKEQLRKEGRRLVEVKALQLAEMAEEYLTAHPSLWEQARLDIARW
jgi:hypothetical protein